MYKILRQGNTTMLLYIIRHGDPDYATDTLTDKGKIQADALAERLSAHGFDEIYTSPLGRAIQTAEPVCKKLNMSYKIENWMSEDLAHDDFSVIHDDGVRDWVFACPGARLIDSAYSLDDWFTNPVVSACKSAKSGYKRVADCSDEFISRLGYKREGLFYKAISPSEKRVAAFCHHGFGTLWLSRLLSIPPNIIWASFDLSHTSVTIVEFKHKKNEHFAPRCLRFNDTSHLD
jgi:probable phosphoglycerate mutase